MSHKTRNKTRGIKSVPHIYDSEDVLNRVMRDAVESDFLMPGIYIGRAVGNVRLATDPKSTVPYEVLVFIPELNESTGEPFNYCLPTEEDYQSLSFFPPAENNLQPPGPGEEVMIQIMEPRERIGFYVGKVDRFDMSDVKGKTTSAVSKGRKIRKPSDSFNEKGKKAAEKNQRRDYEPVEKKQKDSTSC